MSAQIVQDSPRFVQLSTSESVGPPVFRALSPFSIKIEKKSRDLDNFLDLEQEARLRAERQIDDLLHQNHQYHTEIEEAHFRIAQHVDQLHRKDTELSSLRKSLEETRSLVEKLESGLHRRYQATVTDLSSELEVLQRQKEKAERDRTSLLNEIESAFFQVDQAVKEKTNVESRLETLDQQVGRLRGLVESLEKQLNESVYQKIRSQTEILELEKSFQELQTKLTSTVKERNALQAQLEDSGRSYEEESRQRVLLQSQLNSLQHDLDTIQAHYEDESEAASQVRSQISKLSADLASLRTRYEKELLEKTEQIEEIKKRSSLKIAELEESFDRERSKAASLDKTKSKLMIDLNEAHNEIETINKQLSDQIGVARSLEAHVAQLETEIEDLNTDAIRITSVNSSLTGDNQRLRGQIDEVQDRITLVERDNRQLNEDLREQKSTNRDQSRRISDLESGKNQLEMARDNALTDFHDAEDSLHELERRFQVTTNSLSVLRAEMEARLREKDDELESIKKSTHHTIEELNTAIAEMESKHKSDSSRQKKKFETTIGQLESELSAVNHANIVLNEAKEECEHQIKDLEIELTTQHNEYETLLSNFQTSERRRMQVTDELDQMRLQLESSERARKAAEADTFEATSKLTELNLQINNLQTDKRRQEGEISVLQADLDDALSGREALEERATFLKKEVGALAEELREEQERNKKADSLRKSLETEVREMALKLEHLEVQSVKESRKAIQKLQARIRELEIENENFGQTTKEAQNNSRRVERQLKELSQQADEDRRLVLELQELLDKTQIKMKTYKRQAEEAEELANATLNKYRKAQRNLEESEIRASMAERSLRHGAGAGSVSRSQSVFRRSNSICREVGDRVKLASSQDFHSYSNSFNLDERSAQGESPPPLLSSSVETRHLPTEAIS